MRISSLLSILMMTLLVISFSTDAFAKKGDDAEADFTIEDVGVAKVDQFYDGVEGIVTKMQAAQDDVTKAQDKLAKALGLAEGTPVADALADLQSKAEGKIELVLEGTKPTLSVEDGVPENVKEAVNAVNAMAGKLVEAGETLKSCATDLQPMIGQAGDMPAAIADSDLGLKDKAVATKSAAANLKTTKQVLTEAETLAGQCQESLELIKSTFGG